MPAIRWNFPNILKAFWFHFYNWLSILYFVLFQGLPATASLYDLAEKLSNLTSIPQSRMLLKYLRSNDLSLRFVLSPISQSIKMNMIRDIPINVQANQTQCINSRCGLGFYQFDATFFHALLCGELLPCLFGLKGWHSLIICCQIISTS